LYKVLHFYSIVPLCKAGKWRSHNKDLYKVLYLYSTIPLCKGKKMKGHKIRICTKVLHFYSTVPLCKARKWRSHNKDLYKVLYLYSTIPLCKGKKMKGHKIRICTKYYRANLSLGGTIRNITPQIFETHPTLKQHRTHIKKVFNFKLLIKRLHKSCKIWNSN